MALIRPATVLSFLLFIALGCLIVSILSAPIVKQIALATNDNVRFGVFGYCRDINNVEECTGITLGYNVDSLSDSQDFTLPSNARLTLTNLLIIHPIGALLVLILLVLTIASHFYGPGHSPGYLLFLVFFSIFTCVVAIVAFLVDILLFVPHLALGGYIVIGAPACLAIVVIGLCATRRRVVGKADRKRRIAEGANTHHHLGNIETHSNNAFSAEQSITANSSNFGGNSPVDKLPEFATFEVGKPDSDGPGLDETGERIPLNPRHQSPPPGMSMHRASIDNGTAGYSHPPIGLSNYSMGPRPPPPPHMANQYNAGPLPQSHRLPLKSPNNHCAGSFGPPPHIQQYAPSRYGPGPHESPSGPYREGSSSQPVFGGHGMGTSSPPPNNPPMGDPYIRNTSHQDDAARYGRGPQIASRGPSPGVQRFASNRGPSPQNQPGGYYQDSSMPSSDSRGFVRMGDVGSGPVWRNQQQGTQKQQQQLGVTDYPSDDDSRIDTESRGQPSREDYNTTALAPGPGSGRGAGEEHAAIPENLAIPDDSKEGKITSYSIKDGTNYIPPRAQWQQDNNRRMSEGAVQDSQQLNLQNPTPQELPPPKIEEPAVDEPLTNTTTPAMPSKTPAGTYYEDVDPRFASSSHDIHTRGPINTFDGEAVVLGVGYNGRVESPRPPGGRVPPNQANYSAYPYNNNFQPTHRPNGGQQYVAYAPGRSENGLPPQSPAFSEQTNFTSISQRPINPRWQPPPSQHPQGRSQQRNTALLSGNPDFELLTTPHGRGGRGRPSPGVIPPGLGADKGGRYPLPPPNMPR